MPSSPGVELVEDLLRVVGAVVVADAGVVAADDEVRAAVVLAHDRVEDRLARAGVAHRRRVDGQQRAVRRVVVRRAAPRSSASARRPGCRRPWSRRRAGAGTGRRRSPARTSGCTRARGGPGCASGSRRRAASRARRTRARVSRRRRGGSCGEVGVLAAAGAPSPRRPGRLSPWRVDRGDARVRLLGRAVDLLRLVLLVVAVDSRASSSTASEPAVASSERDLAARLRASSACSAVDRQRDRDRPGQPAREPHLARRRRGSRPRP